MKSGGRTAPIRSNKTPVEGTTRSSNTAAQPEVCQEGQPISNFKNVDNSFISGCSVDETIKLGLLGDNPLTLKKSVAGEKNIPAISEMFCVQNPTDKHCMALTGIVREAMRART